MRRTAKLLAVVAMSLALSPLVMAGETQGKRAASAADKRLAQTELYLGSSRQSVDRIMKRRGGAPQSSGIYWGVPAGWPFVPEVHGN